MQLIPISWNGLNINNGTPFLTTIPLGQLVNLSANGISIPRAATYPYLSSKVLNQHTFVIRVVIAPNQDIPTNRELLKAYFNIEDFERHNLVVKDITDGDRQWYLTGLVTRVFEEKAGLYYITILLETPAWRLVTPGSTTWDITASGETQTITTLGNVETPPVFEITPNAAKTGGLRYGRWVPIYNALSSMVTMPLEITDGGLDTEALVNAGKMQSNGNDLRVWLDGVEVDRWLSGVDTAATLVWIYMSLQPGRSATILSNISNIGAVTEIALARTKANLAFLRAMGSVFNKVFLLGAEAFIFTGVDTVGYRLTGVTRAAKGTTAASHTAGDVGRWIQHDLWILYGDSTLGAADVDDAFKPMCNLTSTNDELSFTNYLDEGAPNRRFAWLGEVNATKTGRSYTFTGPQNTFVDPSTELGLALANSPDTTVPQQETGQLDWIFSHPCGLTNVTWAGKKYYIQGVWPAIVGLQVLQANTAWLTLQTETAPIALETWVAFTRSIALGGTYNTIRFAVDGSVSNTPGDMAMVQFDTVVLTVDNGNLPVISVGAEQNIYYFNARLTNNETDEYLLITTPCPLGTMMIVDCEQKLAYLETGERVIVQRSTDRFDWLDLEPGANELQYDDTGTNDVTVVVSHRDRSL